MDNKEILKWWDAQGMVKCASLRQKYAYSNSAVLDVDDYRIIYDGEFKN